MDVINSVIIPLSVLAGAMATIFGLFSVIVRGVKWFLALPQEVRNYFFRPRFILIPTPAEIALYGAKEPSSSVRLSAAEYIEEEKGWANKRHERWRRDADLRVRVLRLCVVSVYTVFFLKLIKVGIVSHAGNSVSRIPMVLFIAFLLAVAIVAIRILGRERCTAIVKNFWY
jgi:hypothetical protein